ncbi:MAG: ATP-binding protein, partial [Gemmataceae bacterium]
QRRMFRGSVQDITERKQAENALRESELRLQEAQRIGKIGHWELNHDSKELTWSSAIHLILEVPNPGSMDGFTALLERIHAEDRDAFDRAFRNSLRLRRPFAIEYRILARDGTIKHVHEECETTFDSQGKPVRTLGTMQDITDRKMSEIALARMNEELERRVMDRTAELTRLTAILDASPDFIVITNDPTKEVAYVNQGMRRLAQARGKPTSDLNFADFHPESSIRKLREEGLPTAIRDGSWIGETEVIGPNGSPIQVSQLILSHRGEDGKIQYLSTVMRDITKLKKVELALRDREDRLKAILSALPDLIFLVDGDTIFRESYCRDPELLLFPPEVFLGKRIAEVLPEQLATQFLRAMKAAHEDRSVQILEYPLDLRTRKSWFESRFVACGPKNSLVVVRDISKQKQAAEEMSLANANLAQAARMKDEFLANMSHELRTPLNGILAFTEAVLEEIYGPLTPKQRTALVDIEACGRHLLALINDILDLAKFEAGKITLDISETVPSEIAQSSLNFIKQLAQNKKIVSHLLVNATPFSADARRLKQILVNLLSNAIKFTPEGGEIGLEIHGNPDEGKIHFTVWDTGIGIKPEDIGSLFQPFHQIDSKLSREYAGTGLGLSLVQRLANLHGGTVTVKSRHGGGSRFTVTLPYAPIAS